MMQCGFHAYMESWAIAIENPYYSFSDAKGQFSIQDIPPGTYRIRAWHPGVKEQISKTVTIEPQSRVIINIQLPSPGERRTAHKIRTPPRFTQAALGRPVDIQPLVEQQLP